MLPSNVELDRSRFGKCCDAGTVPRAYPLAVGAHQEAKYDLCETRNMWSRTEIQARQIPKPGPFLYHSRGLCVTADIAIQRSWMVP